jgi:plasmid stabilization system protein ParE
MAYKIRITEHAREDTQVAYDYYENTRTGLGEEFLSELLKQFNDLASTPHNYGYIDDQAIIRDVKIDRFPYVVVFEIIQDEVVVYAVHNTYRHPKKRLRK